MTHNDPVPLMCRVVPILSVVRWSEANSPWLAVAVCILGALVAGSLVRRETREIWRRALSPGARIIVLLALGSALLVTRLRIQRPAGMQLWVFSETHHKAYEPIVHEWNRLRPDRPVTVSQLHIYALERRTLAGFLAGTPVADLIAAERPTVAKTFTGPLETVGFVDLTDRLQQEGLLAQLAPASLTPWTNRGRIFGIPLDVHPVLLAYRADLVEAAGIDVSRIETWDDYFHALRPLMQDLDGDGRPDRWLLNLWETNADLVLMILQQAGGDLFDPDGHPCLHHPRNIEVLARVVTWMAGPERVCTEIDLFSASGNQQRMAGVVVGELAPDWMAGKWKLEIPALEGRLKLMPLPAWEPGGRRTSVWRGGTMLGISKTTPNPEEAWQLARHIALAPALAEQLFRTTTLVPPNQALWSLPVFDEPDPYYSGQPIGRLYLDQMHDVPPRSSSPYFTAALNRLGAALVRLRDFADATRSYDSMTLQTEARRLLHEAQRELEREISRNTFLDSP